MAVEYAMRGLQEVVIDRIVTRLDVDRDDLADVFVRLDLGAKALLVQLLTAPGDLFTGEAWMGHDLLLCRWNAIAIVSTAPAALTSRSPGPPARPRPSGGSAGPGTGRSTACARCRGGGGGWRAGR